MDNMDLMDDVDLGLGRGVLDSRVGIKPSVAVGQSNGVE